MASSSAVSWIHERMPAILDTDEDVANWLDSYNISVPKALSGLRASVNLCFHPVSMDVNRVKNQDINLSQPVDLDKPKPLSDSAKLMANWLSKASERSAVVRETVKREADLKENPGHSFPKKTKSEH